MLKSFKLLSEVSSLLAATAGERQAVFVVEFVAVETPAVTAEGGEEGVEVGVVDAADAVAVEHPLGLDLLPPPPDWAEEGGVPHGQLLPRLDPRLGSQLDGGRRVADWLQVGQAGVGEEGDHGVEGPALPRYQRYGVGLQHSEHVLDVLQADPVQRQFFAEEGEHDLHRLDDLGVCGPLLPVVHQLLHFLPLVWLVPLEEENPEERHGCVDPLVAVLTVQSWHHPGLGEEETLLAVVRTVLAPGTTQRPLTTSTRSDGPGGQLQHNLSNIKSFY